MQRTSVWKHPAMSLQALSSYTVACPGKAVSPNKSPRYLSVPTSQSNYANNHESVIQLVPEYFFRKEVWENTQAQLELPHSYCSLRQLSSIDILPALTH